MTALAGMSLLMEGSTIREGKYAEKIRKAVDWFMERSQRNGLLGNPNNPTEAARYIYGHGYGILFLSQVYGEEEDNDRRKKLEQILTKAVEFTGKAQTNRGGWGYVSAAAGYQKLFPESREGDRHTWSNYRKATFDYLLKSQNADGSWNSGNIGAVYTTSINLAILQLDKGTLPIYQR